VPTLFLFPAHYISGIVALNAHTEIPHLPFYRLLPPPIFFSTYIFCCFFSQTNLAKCGQPREIKLEFVIPLLLYNPDFFPLPFRLFLCDSFSKVAAFSERLQPGHMGFLFYPFTLKPFSSGSAVLPPLLIFPSFFENDCERPSPLLRHEHFSLHAAGIPCRPEVNREPLRFPPTMLLRSSRSPHLPG